MSDSLLSVTDAVRRISEHLPPPRATSVPLAESLGLVLVEEVRSDLDMPPFAKSMMDGFAVRAADTVRAADNADRPATLKVVDTIHAGSLPKRGVAAGQASRIMTGAPVPAGADAVVAVEKTESEGRDVVRILETVAVGKNVVPQGQDVWEGVTVLSPGRRIRPPEIGVLAAVGKSVVRVYDAPRVAIFSTGDEVVPPAREPGPGQIRNSNSSALVARVTRDRGTVEDLGVLPDETDLMRSALRAALGSFDVVILTGGVSMGEKDLVGGALVAEGFHEVFHKIRLKPGKPALFGTAKGSLVFGLPGNPCSVAVTYELLVRPVLRYLMGYAPVHRPRVTATLESDPPKAIPREQFIPAHVVERPGGFTVETVSWHGSGDLFGFAAANSLLRIPAGGPSPAKGEAASVVVIEESLSGLLGRLPK